MTESTWFGGDFQDPPRSDGGVALCGACHRTGQCRLGLSAERLGDDGVATFELACPSGHEGGPGVAHGGWTASVLDEALGHVGPLNGQMTVTGTLTVRYERPVPIERPLLARAWIDGREPRKWRIAGELVLASSGAPLARAEGIFVLRRREAHFAEFARWLAEQ